MALSNGRWAIYRLASGGCAREAVGWAWMEEMESTGTGNGCRWAAPRVDCVALHALSSSAQSAPGTADVA